MFGEKFRCAGYAALLLLAISCETGDATDKYHCPATSCGGIPNISYPFRLKGNPENCGHPDYELSCENNITILYLFSGKYFVQEIDYNNSTIRIVDVGLQKENCSSLPLHSISSYNFTQAYPLYLIGKYTYKLVFGLKSIIFITCQNPENSSSLYVETAPCINSSNSVLTQQQRYSYVIIDRTDPSDLEDMCTIDLVAKIRLSRKNDKKISYIDIHNDLLSGFELSWRTNELSGFELSRRTNDFLEGWLLYFLGWLLYLLTTLWTARCICGTPLLIIFLVYKWQRRHLSMFDRVEGFLRSQNNLIPIRFSFSHIKRMTHNFSEKLGKGGYGSVYKGKLRKTGKLVAVKLLENSKANGQEFINEVATIGRIHHVNVVRLIGFCAERSKRALVYEFMPNGSLEKYIFSPGENISLSYQQMFEIALGVARGIEYLHRGCDIQILHFDIKPHNILLDENFNAKVSDFGLAKLYPKEDSIVSLMAARGTYGYMAPELHYKNIGGVSYKADVYSYGMLLMEMAGRRKNLDAYADHSSQIYFPTWVYDQVNKGKEIEISDATEMEKEIVKKMSIVALWCIQMKPGNRPSMNRVVEMLEGEVENLEIPPKPFLSQQENEEQDLQNASNESSYSLSLTLSRN